MKLISKKDIWTLLILAPIFLLAVIASLCYFFPMPEEIEKISKSAVGVDRCVYKGRIAYAVIFELTTLQSDMKTVIYSPTGETICTSTGMVKGVKQESCNENRLCMPIYKK